MAERRLHILAVIGLVLGLLAVVLLREPAAWRAWLGAACLAMAIPTGAIGWSLIMRLAVGDWTGPLAEACAALAGRMPYVALLFLPVLMHPQLYPWVGRAQPTAFRAAYLSVAFFDVRTLAWLGGLSLAGWRIASGRPVSKATACAGLIAFFLMTMLIAVDWIGSLDPTFNSSGFGLYIAALQFGAAWCMAILAGEPEETHRAGALLLTLMLLWGYFAFMLYFIPWSGNLRGAMDFYLVRQRPPWPWTMGAIAACRLPVLFALFFRSVRHSRRWMVALACVVLAGSVLEFAWLTLPGSNAGALTGLIYTVVTLAGLAAAWPPRVAIPDEGGAA